MRTLVLFNIGKYCFLTDLISFGMISLFVIFLKKNNHSSVSVKCSDSESVGLPKGRLQKQPIFSLLLAEGRE